MHREASGGSVGTLRRGSSAYHSRGQFGKKVVKQADGSGIKFCECILHKLAVWVLQRSEIDKSKVSAPSECRFIPRKDLSAVEDDADKAAMLACAPRQAIEADEARRDCIYSMVATDFDLRRLSAALRA
jgi:hypothetical protein